MQSSISDVVKKLNRLSLLYDNAIVYSKPYRISRIREMYQMAVAEATSRYSLQNLDSENYREMFGANSSLEIVVVKKEEAISKGDYELAAFFRDREKMIIQSQLLLIGANKTDKFFVWENRIYKK